MKAFQSNDQSNHYIKNAIYNQTTLTIIDVKLYTIDNIENDFSDMPQAFSAYIRLKSYQKKQSRISSRINRYKKYYEKPAELFARLVEGLYIDCEWVEAIAPNVTQRFYELLNSGYYMELSTIISSCKHF